ncbi:hypothetical protein LguiB_026629 [Lonicera macranthoides]
MVEMIDFYIHSYSIHLDTVRATMRLKRSYKVITYNRLLKDILLQDKKKRKKKGVGAVRKGEIPLAQNCRRADQLMKPRRYFSIWGRNTALMTDYASTTLCTCLSSALPNRQSSTSTFKLSRQASSSTHRVLGRGCRAEASDVHSLCQVLLRERTVFLQLVRQHAGDVHSKVVLSSWLRYERKEDELVGTSLLDCVGQFLKCPKAALIHGYDLDLIYVYDHCKCKETHIEKSAVDNSIGVECSTLDEYEDGAFVLCIGDGENLFVVDEPVGVLAATAMSAAIQSDCTFRVKNSLESKPQSSRALLKNSIVLDLIAKLEDRFVIDSVLNQYYCCYNKSVLAEDVDDSKFGDEIPKFLHFHVVFNA